MKRTLTILSGVLLCLGAFAPLAQVRATELVIAVGDRPYYTHGPFYVESGVRWEWVPGHWAIRHHQRVWIHGRYVRR